MCGGKTCLNKNKFKDYDELLSMGAKLGARLGDEGAKLYKRASHCHSMNKNTPDVEGFFTMFPCNLCCTWLPCGLPLDFCLWCIPCCNCCCFIPFDCCIAIPWNFWWVVILSGFVLSIAGL